MPRKKSPLQFEILGIEEITKFFQELGNVPQKTVKKAAKSGATIIKRDTLGSIQLPVRYGFLRDSITLVEEHPKGWTEDGKKIGRNTSGKSAYEVTFNSAFNKIFQKPINPARVGIYGGKKPTGYYPASMEYGFKNAKGGVGGHHFLKLTAVADDEKVRNKMLEIMSKDIDAIKAKKV